ncbi:MAG: PepSY-associated TM helix domain-containing protein [Pseudomonadota bacterium]
MLPKIRAIHAWCGLLLCLLLAVLSLSGTALIFQDDYVRATVPEARQPVDLNPAVIGAAMERIEADIGADNLSYVLLARDTLSLHRIVMRNGDAAFARQDGQIVQRWSKNGRIEDWVFHLHHYLFLGDFGKYLAGVAALITGLMTISGIYLVWPLLRAFRLRVWPRSRKRLDLRAYHRNTGFVFALPILVLALTGAGMVFHKQADTVLDVITLSKRETFNAPKGLPGDVNWRAALQHTRSEFPDAQLRLVIWPRNKTATATVRLKQPGEWHQNGRSYSFIDASTSRVVATRDALTLSRGERASNTIYPLHSAGIGGRVYDAVAAVTGIALVILALVGAWSYLQLLRSRQQQRKPRTSAAGAPQ